MGSVLLLLLVFGTGAGLAVAFVIYYVLFHSEDFERIVGWIAGGVARVIRKADRAAVGFKVQGAINTARADFLRDGPEDLIERPLKIRWRDAEGAEAILKEGEVLVVMKRSGHHEENVANALMAYLPKAMLSRARPYIERERMRAADLMVAKGVLMQSPEQQGALDAFFDNHLDPARDESEDLKTKIAQLDEVDLQGWLTRLLLVEYRLLGEELHPGEPDKVCLRDAEELARWAGDLAGREPGETGKSLSFPGRYFKVAMIFVGIKGRLAEEGLRPYRKRVKRYLYQDRYDAIYLSARDSNMPAVETLADELEQDGLVATVERYRFPLRRDFKKRKLDRERAILVCLRRRQGGGGTPPPDEPGETEDLPEERYEPSSNGGRSRTDAPKPEPPVTATASRP